MELEVTIDTINMMKKLKQENKIIGEIERNWKRNSLLNCCHKTFGVRVPVSSQLIKKKTIFKDIHYEIPHNEGQF